MGVMPMAVFTDRDNEIPERQNGEHTAAHDPLDDSGIDFVLIQDIKPPPRIALARERLLISRLYLGLIRSIHDDYGAEFATHSDSATIRTIGIYVFLRTVMCSPVRASTIANVLKLPRVTVLRRLQEMVKHGYIERVGNAYRVTDKVNIPALQEKLQRRVNMIVETAKELAKLETQSEDPGIRPE
jgi:DNA-binding MarR family transcriptional regulator